MNGYFAPMLATIAMVGLSLATWYAIAYRDDYPLNLVMVANCGVAFIIIVHNYQLTQSIAYAMAAFGVAGIGGMYLKNLTGRASERRLWRKLFGETFWQLLLNDPRRRKQ